MAIKSEALIYKLIEQHIKSASSPVTCTDLWDHPDIRANAKSPEKVSDYLGLMWRREVLQRWHTPITSVSKSRYAYSWREQEDENKYTVEPPAPKLVQSNYKKAKVTITEDDTRIILDFENFTMTIQSKG